MIEIIKWHNWFKTVKKSHVKENKETCRKSSTDLLGQEFFCFNSRRLSIRLSLSLSFKRLFFSFLFLYFIQIFILTEKHQHNFFSISRNNFKGVLENATWSYYRGNMACSAGSTKPKSRTCLWLITWLIRVSVEQSLPASYRLTRHPPT